MPLPDARAVNTPLAQLLSLLDLERVEADLYRSAPSPDDPRNGLYGGLVAAQAIAAAGHDVAGQALHSLHACFLRAGDPSAPVFFRVTGVRDGRSFSTRQITALQGETELVHLMASFQRPGPGYEHQQPMPEAPDPEDLPSVDEILEAAGNRLRPAARVWAEERSAIDVRYSQVPIYLGGRTGSEPCLAWFRASGPVTDGPGVDGKPIDEPTLHRCLITYASDISLNDNALRPYGHKGPLGPLLTTSLDHGIWFHADARADEWLLYAMESTRAGGGRGYSRGSIFRRDGVHVASVTQESMMRPIGGSAGGGTGG